MGASVSDGTVDSVGGTKELVSERMMNCAVLVRRNRVTGNVQEKVVAHKLTNSWVCPPAVDEGEKWHETGNEQMACFGTWKTMV
ncbi:hypothetical protein T265_05476 [Opisthorchis viverrini]|uniref:Uncharacterized protein n=1 Tax=Opisthorchis viverrini TaxID=6198 RepID=A0A075AFA4_OPIVI|nr:hypothetical protein T265_05476 [Opisthorchis viverrini]KER27519.1 hypothetical protein T265_05476 [Opisthorchis viverrini]